MKVILGLAAAAILSAVGASSASAQAFGVDFGTGSTYSGTGVLGESFTGGNGSEHINYADGSPTGATVDVNPPSGVGPLGGSAGPFDTTNDGPANELFVDGLFIGNKGPAVANTTLGYQIAFNVSGLSPDTAYQLAVYAGSGDSTMTNTGGSQLVDFGSGGAGDVVETVTQDSSVPNYRSDFILGEDYALSTETTDSGGNLFFQVQGDNFADPIVNGFGISAAPVPEPGTFTLLGAGVLLLHRRTRRACK